MALKKTGATAKKYINPTALLVTLLNQSEEGAYEKDTTTYQVQNVLKDSTSITQDDPERNSIDDEFDSAPIDENIKLGNQNFTSTICDFQKDILVTMLGYVEDPVSHKLYAPSGYQERYAEIALVFNDKAIVLPKVKLNSKMIIESLSTSLGQVTLAGTAQNMDITDGMNHYTASSYVDPTFAMPE